MKKKCRATQFPTVAVISTDLHGDKKELLVSRRRMAASVFLHSAPAQWVDHLSVITVKQSVQWTQWTSDVV